MIDLVTYENRGQAAVLTLNRPERRNAVDVAMCDALRAALSRLDADPAARTGILTGAGGVFCAGMDLQAFLEGHGEAILFGPGRFAGLVSAPPAKPLIAAVEGAALAGGCELALACDMIVASESATFGLPEPGIGIFAVGGGAFRLGRRIPPAKATALCLTGERIDATEADRLGLLTALVAPGEALAGALDLAARIARNSARALHATLELARASRTLGEAALWARSDQLWPYVAASPDAEEGPRAFREKRPPDWINDA